MDFGKVVRSGLRGPLTEALAAYYVVSSSNEFCSCHHVRSLKSIALDIRQSIAHKSGSVLFGIDSQKLPTCSPKLQPSLRSCDQFAAALGWQSFRAQLFMTRSYHRTFCSIQCDEIQCDHIHWNEGWNCLLHVSGPRSLPSIMQLPMHFQRLLQTAHIAACSQHGSILLYRYRDTSYTHIATILLAANRCHRWRLLLERNCVPKEYSRVALWMGDTETAHPHCLDCCTRLANYPGWPQCAALGSDNFG